MQISADSRVKLPGHLRREHFWNAPNTITLSRIAAVPLLLLLPVFPGPLGSLVIGFGFLAVALTDLLDGYLARRDGTTTRIGKLLDPLADKLLIMAALVVLVSMPGRIPLWALPLVLVILAREISITSLRAMASSEGVVFGASPLAKWKTGFQSAALTCLVLYHPLVGLPMHEIGLGLLGLATFLTLWSGYEYFAAYLFQERDESS